MRILWLLVFAILCIQPSTWAKRGIVSKEQSRISASKDPLSRAKNRDSSMKKLQELLKKASNSSSNATRQVTVTRQGPCECAGGVCNCCSRILFETWKQKACVDVTYDPDEFSFTAKIMMNDRVLFTRTVSGKNPKPVCVSVPRLPIVKACARFYNIYFLGRNIHMCLNMEGKFQDITVFKVGLDCIRFGADGLAMIKPEDGGGLGQIQFLSGGNDDQDEDDYNYDDDEEDFLDI
nr:uncharacterized protein LOC117600465 [Osmia lignaria]